MATTQQPLNPYIAGRAVGGERGFFGRQDILREVERTLTSPDQNALVLFGQRRVGKTSVLLQLEDRMPPESRPPTLMTSGSTWTTRRGRLWLSWL